jgi:hypothetical protein
MTEANQPPPAAGSARGSARAPTGGPAKSPVDSPDAAVGSLEQALVAAAKVAGAEPAGDPRVSASLQLGWLMDDLLDGRRQALLAGQLDASESAVAGALAQANRLAALVASLKLDGLDPTIVVDAVKAGPAKAAAADWQPGLVATLFGADARLAKAYGLGRQLGALGHAGGTEQDVRQALFVSMVGALDDLSSVLPPHAGRAVANSMRRWSAASGSDGTVLGRQCELWRGLLAGEKRGTELLEPENYLDAADRLAAKLRATATAVLRRLGWLVAVIVLLFGGGVALVVLDSGRIAAAAAGLSGVLAAIGLTWSGIGGALGRLIGKLEAPLWQAELDGAIADAITLIDKTLPTTSIRRLRQRTATGDYAGRAARARGTLTR